MRGSCSLHNREPKEYNSSREEDSLFHPTTPAEAGQPQAVPVLALHTSLGMGPGQGLDGP